MDNLAGISLEALSNIYMDDPDFPNRPEDLPKYLNLFVDKQIADHLIVGAKDNELKLENVYRLLKDQLKRAKADLLNVRRAKDESKAKANQLRDKIRQAVDRAQRHKLPPIKVI
jgi:translation initiation factor 2B subunit (eIF-2B alpha/beta/delta family)